MTQWPRPGVPTFFTPPTPAERDKKRRTQERSYSNIDKWADDVARSVERRERLQAQIDREDSWIRFDPARDRFMVPIQSGTIIGGELEYRPWPIHASVLRRLVQDRATEEARSIAGRIKYRRGMETRRRNEQSELERTKREERALNVEAIREALAERASDADMANGWVGCYERAFFKQRHPLVPDLLILRRDPRLLGRTMGVL